MFLLARLIIGAAFLLAAHPAVVLAQDNTRQISVESVGEQAAGRRVALVIGNNVYSNLDAGDQLVTAVNDARAVRAALGAMGYEVIYGENVTRDQFLDKFSEFQSLIDKDTIALFYYAGHGVQLRNGSGNYLLPSDIIRPQSTKPFEEDRLAQRSIPDTYVVEGMKKAGADVAVIVLDACRNNPLSAQQGRAVLGGQGLSRVDYPKGVFSIYSAGYGEMALDRLPGEDDKVNSVFTRSFLRYLPQPALSLQDFARKVGDEVDKLASENGHSQAPAYIDQIRGRTVYLAGPPPGEAGADASSEQAIEKQNLAQFEITYWNSVKDSSDPGPFELYLRQYPGGKFADLARQKLQELTAARKDEDDREQEEERLWREASSANDPQRLTQYLERYPAGTYAGEAKSRLAQIAASAAAPDAETILWEAVKDGSEPSQLRVYLDKYPAGRFSMDARARITQLEMVEKNAKMQEELRAWESIQYSSDPQVYTAFIARYPQSTFANVARQKAASLSNAQNSQMASQTTSPSAAQYADTGNTSSSAAGCLGSTDPAEAVALYYRALDMRDADCASRLWVKPPKSLAKKVRNFAGASVQQFLSSTRLTSSTAIVEVIVSVSAINGPWEQYRMSIRLRLGGGVWLIEKMDAI